MKYIITIVLFLFVVGIVLIGSTASNDPVSSIPFTPHEYKIYEILKETQQGNLFEEARTYYVVFYIDSDNSIKKVSGSADDTRNVLHYKLSYTNQSRLIKTKSGFYYDEWDLYLPKEEK